MWEQRLRVLRQSLKRCCTRSIWLAGTDIVLIGCPPSTVEWTADDTNSFSKIHAALPKGHDSPGGACLEDIPRFQRRFPCRPSKLVFEASLFGQVLLNRGAVKEVP